MTPRETGGAASLTAEQQGARRLLEDHALLWVAPGDHGMHWGPFSQLVKLGIAQRRVSANGLRWEYQLLPDLLAERARRAAEDE